MVFLKTLRDARNTWKTLRYQKKKKKKTITNGDLAEILQYTGPAITGQPPEDDTESLSTPRKAHPLPAEKKGSGSGGGAGEAVVGR
ncbi:hypothetical protein BU17DRAFT_100703 [Hysterangium stoloniferum]|nr:hypothetical protein BU17DRAFT_100703 [Hysterangium stoloniferum]